MANINRDYLIVLDAKSSVITEADELKYYITDEHSKNLFVNLVVKETNRINKYVEVHNPEKYQLELHIVKPNNDIVRPQLQGNLLSVEEAIYGFELPKEAADYIGTYKCELRVTYQESEEKTITTSNKFKYKVKRSIYNDLDSIQEAPKYPVVIQLFDKLSDIEQYEEDRRANELARQLTEQQRQDRFDTLCNDVAESIEAIDNKVVDVENRISAKEHAVDTLIADTKTDIDNYKATKDQEIDNYKANKDTEIDNAITAQDTKISKAIARQDNKITDAITRQDSKIDTAIINQNDRIAVVENNVTTQNSKLDVLENRNTIHELRMTDIEAKNSQQDIRLDAIEAIDVAQNARLEAIESKNTEQDNRLSAIEKVNKKQDMDLKCLFTESKNNMIDITEEGNSIYLQNSTIGYTLIDEIKGNTLVNCNKEPNKELILNGNINTSADNNITLTEGVDGGLVDVALEGNTLVNVSKTKDSTAITKAYTVENSGNHVALQGDIDGNCRPVITGNTLVNCIRFNRVLNSATTVNDNVYTFTRRTVNEGNTAVIFDTILKDNTTYTMVFDILKNDYSSSDYSDNRIEIVRYANAGTNVLLPVNSGVGQYKQTFTTNFSKASDTSHFWIGVQYSNFLNNTDILGDIVIGNIIILEGNYSDKPIPDYFEGLQSTFEDNLVTQEMVDSGEEVADNLGKYKVEYKSTQEDGTVGNTKTVYLNSPLLEGDTIEEKDGGIYHVHRSELVAYAEGDETSSITDKINTLHKLALPTYELIEQSNLAISSYTNGHLDLASAVPVSKVNFLHFEEELTYLYPSTSYTVQFISDKAITVDMNLGGALLLSQSIVAGLNRISITTPATLVDNKLVISGVGAKISKVVVTDTDREFGYFEGMKSVGECEELAITSANSDNTLLNTQQLTHEPLRAVGNVKDKYVLIDGKWYINRNCQQISLTKDISYWILSEDDNNITFQCTISNYFTNLTSCSTRDKAIIADKKVDAISMNSNTMWIKLSKNITYDMESFKNYLPMNLVIPLATPVYELIDYNPLEVYSDITHISTNSVIPCNIAIKNHGFNCLLKPNTTYTVSSNLGLNTITTGADIGDSYLRFMDTDTSNVTTMKDVLVLEGDWTTKSDLIPVHFSGIESAFEQEYDTEKGKYKVNIKVTNEDKTKENNITFYINEALRGIGDAKDRVYVKDDKVVVERNCGALVFDGRESWILMNNFPSKIYALSLTNVNTSIMCDKIIPRKYSASAENYWAIFYSANYLRIQTPISTVDEFKQWLQQNPTTVVYQLAEPTYEEIEYDDIKLFIESFKNSTLSYNSNVPVTSKLYYSYSVPLVDKVAQTANISDQQDSMIIDMATQVAVMEIMLM